MSRAAILPSNWHDPTGIDKVERGAMRDFDRRFAAIRRKYIQALQDVPYSLVTNARYEFQLDQYTLTALLENIAVVVDEIILQGGLRAPWLFEGYVSTAYQRGTAQTFANLTVQSTAYTSSRPDLATVLRSDPYQRRISLVRARVFEEMKGLSATVKADMGRVLTDGIARGKNPREIAKNLTEQAGIEARRAHVIARTEVPMALRRARWDEGQDAQETYALRMKLLHLSALSPSTRPTHAARHAHLYTRDQVRDWYSVDGNAINCKCGQTEVLVDKNGKAVVPSIIARARQTYAVMKERSEAEWAKG